MKKDIKEFFEQEDHGLQPEVIERLATFLIEERQWIHIDSANSKASKVLVAVITSKIDSSRNKGGNKMYIEGYQDGLIEAKSIISEQLD